MMKREIYAKLYSRMQQEGLDFLIATGFETILHLTGFESMTQALNRHGQLYVALCAKDGALRYAMPVAELPSAAERGMDPACIHPYGGFIFAYGKGDTAEKLAAAGARAAAGPGEALLQILGSGAKRVGMELGGLDARVRAALQSALPKTELQAEDGFFQELRVIKTAEEIEYLRRASAIAEMGIRRVCERLRPGMSEREAVQQYCNEVIHSGAANTFAVITFGQRAAFVDTAPSGSNLLRVGDMIRFDVGCRYGGYHADMARTAVLGQADEKLARTYAAVLAGERKALAAIKPGRPLGDIFRTAVQETRKAGLVQYDRHHCGHSIGLTACEAPLIDAGQEAPIKPGMALCVETPYYELGWGGVQVEDTLVVTEEGYELLTPGDPGLIVL